MNKTKPIFYFLLFLCIIFSGCKFNKEEQEITKMVNEWYDREIIFPQQLVFTRFGQDTLLYEIAETDYKILLYVDSAGCTSCKLQLLKWNQFIEQVDSLTSGKVQVLFFFHPSNEDKREIIYLLKRNAITIPVCIDETDMLNSINQFPSRGDFQCFLLDNDNKVKLIGNPTRNIKIKEMYISSITSKEYSSTTAYGDKNNCNFKISENFPLLIYNTSVCF